MRYPHGQWSYIRKLHNIYTILHTMEYNRTIEFLITNQGLQNNVTILRRRTADYNHLAEGSLAQVGDQVETESPVVAQVVHHKEFVPGIPDHSEVEGHNHQLDCSPERKVVTDSWVHSLHQLANNHQKAATEILQEGHNH
jgi:hypothetical protein